MNIMIDTPLSNPFYTYAWLRVDKTPYYVGKGKGNRAWRKGSPPKDRVLILKKDLTEDEAFKHEKYMIFVLGRKDKGNGMLRNRSDGGDGNSGYRHTQQTKIRLSRKLRGRSRGPMSPIVKLKLSKALKGKKSWLGLRHKPETKEKISRLRKELGLAKGEKNPMYGRSHSDESRNKMKETKRNKQSGVGKVWYHNPMNGIEKQFSSSELPPPPWTKGRSKTNHNQMWMCKVTGYINTPCGLSAHQKARGIDTSRRVKLSPEEMAFIYAWDPNMF